MDLSRTPLQSLGEGRAWSTSQRIKQSRKMRGMSAVLSRAHRKPSVIRKGQISHRRNKAMNKVRTSGGLMRRGAAKIWNRIKRIAQKRVGTGIFSRWRRKADDMDYVTKVEAYESLVEYLQESRASR